MAPQLCPNCKLTDFELDTSSGEYCCKECGTVVEESRIVSEVTFGESASGAAIVTGSFVAADQAHASSSGGLLYGSHGESRAMTVEKTKRRINGIAAKLHIHDHVAAMAVQYFKLALNHNFVKGRKSQYVVSACLYLACRQNRTMHMLMDFAEAIFVNVFIIGSTYLQLIKTLGITGIPLKDPSLFIQRFASKLSLQDDGKRVVNDAAKLVHRMGKDWLTEGRRPAGIAAACVLLAARMNNIRVSKAQIVQIAKVGEDTVQRRLNEFSATSAGSLPVGVFRATNIESEADPPSFLRHRENEKKMAERAAREQELLDKGESLVDNELFIMAQEIDKNLEEVGEALEENNNDQEQPATADEPDKQDDDGVEARSRMRAEQFLNRYQAQKAAAIAAALAQGNEDLDNNPDNSSGAWASQIPDDPEDLADVDDEEIEATILTEMEAEIKSQVWMSMNREYLIEQENKRLKMEADKAAGIYKPPKKRKRPRHKENTFNVGPDGAPLTAAESAKQMLQSRAFSKKINYAAMDVLFKPDPKEEE
jgi:transcription factor IIIB subunit 2